MSRLTFDLPRPALLLLTVGAVAGPACATDNGLSGGAGMETSTGSTLAYATGGSPSNGTGGRSASTGGSRNVGGSIGGAINGYSFVGTVTPAPGANVIPVPSN